MGQWFLAKLNAFLLPPSQQQTERKQALEDMWHGATTLLRLALDNAPAAGWRGCFDLQADLGTGSPAALVQLTAPGGSTVGAWLQGGLTLCPESNPGLGPPPVRGPFDPGPQGWPWLALVETAMVGEPALIMDGHGTLWRPYALDGTAQTYGWESLTPCACKRRPGFEPLRFILAPPLEHASSQAVWQALPLSSQAKPLDAHGVAETLWSQLTQTALSKVQPSASPAGA
ncbi:hypothetical protein E3E12_02035 [Formicincola oecophyllae]|uniref:Uncharacterized protein n=1 Tax=Formicincola oecophyllae TaxID=2558361 RepID=A0A4Y6U9P8_9PROT|nr:hypothetical protein [Formicincola oecophyllae]QDH13176.1 hypothetical protein E3E12_02035 [Formicincola oecophyllae]